jgi:lambda family phage tail tape measure protein
MEKATTTSGKLGTAVKGLGNDLAGAARTGNIFVDSVIGAISRLGPLGAGIGVVAGAIGFLGSRAVNAADQVTDLSNATGIAASRLLNLKQSLISAGGDAQSFEKIAIRLNQNLGEAAEGNDKLAYAFRQLGVNLGDASGNLRSTDEILPEVLAALNAIPDPAIKSAKAVELLGKEAAKIDWTNVSAGKDAIKDEQIKQLEKYKGAIDELSISIENNLITAFGKLAIKIQEQGGIMGTLQWLSDLSLDLQTATIRLLAGDKAANSYYETMKKLAGVPPVQTATGTAAPGTPAAAAAPAVAAATGPLALTDAQKAIIKASQEQTTAFKATNEQAVKYQQALNATIGLQQTLGDIERANLAIEQDRLKQVAALQQKIDDERKKKEQDPRITASVTAEYQKQINVVNANAAAMSKARTDEIVALERQKSLMEDIALINRIMVDNVQLNQLTGQNELIGLFGEELKQKQAIQQIDNERESKIESINAKLRAMGANATAEDQRRAETEIANAQRVADEKLRILQEGQAKQAEIDQNYYKGIEIALSQIAEQFKPIDVAQQAITNAWGKIGNAVDEFVQTGKFKFSDFAKSVLRDLAAMIIKAQIFKAIQATLGMFGFSLPGLAAGGPAQANQPYIVGEKGPELFMPRSSGTVIPNNKLGDMANATGTGAVNAPITNNYITNNISALDSKSVAQLFAENRKTLLGTVQMAQREMPFG